MSRKVLFALLMMPSMAFAQAGPPYRHSINNPEDVSGIAHGFSKSFRKFLGTSAEIRECTHVIDQAVGTANGNHSYGAICKVQIGKSVHPAMVCNDLMVGHFAISAGTFAMADDDVADFTRRNCYGG